jgi:hypothetical protein
MHLLAPVLPIALALQTDLEMEAARLQHNYEFLSAGLIAAWVVLGIYVLILMGRGRKLKREIASLRAMLEDRERPKA